MHRPYRLDSSLEQTHLARELGAEIGAKREQIAKRSRRSRHACAEVLGIGGNGDGGGAHARLDATE
eukprot:6193822-Pleurochrysis_carterae.AAC.5